MTPPGHSGHHWSLLAMREPKSRCNCNTQRATASQSWFRSSLLPRYCAILRRSRNQLRALGVCGRHARRSLAASLDSASAGQIKIKPMFVAEKLRKPHPARPTGSAATDGVLFGPMVISVPLSNSGLAETCPTRLLLSIMFDPRLGRSATDHLRQRLHCHGGSQHHSSFRPWRASSCLFGRTSDAAGSAWLTVYPTTTTVDVPAALAPEGLGERHLFFSSR